MPRWLLGSVLVHSVGDASLDTVIAHVLLPLLVGGRLDLSWRPLVEILGGRVSGPTLVQFLVLFIGGWWQFHFIANLLLWALVA